MCLMLLGPGLASTNQVVDSECPSARRDIKVILVERPRGSARKCHRTDRLSSVSELDGPLRSGGQNLDDGIKDGRVRG